MISNTFRSKKFLVIASDLGECATRSIDRESRIVITPKGICLQTNVRCWGERKPHRLRAPRAEWIVRSNSCVSDVLSRAKGYRSYNRGVGKVIIRWRGNNNRKLSERTPERPEFYEVRALRRGVRKRMGALPAASDWTTTYRLGGKGRDFTTAERWMGYNGALLFGVIWRLSEHSGSGCLIARG